MLKEGRLFRIRDFDVFRSVSNYRVTDHKYMIRFTEDTKMEEVEEEKYDIRLEKFHLHAHNHLLQLINKTEDLPDVIGFLCKMDKAGLSGENKSKRLVLDIYLEGDIKTRLTIWDDLALSIVEKLTEANERIIVIVATSLIPKTFAGKLCLSVSSATKIYINADFDEVRDFRGRMKIQPEFDDIYKKLESNNSDTQLHSIAEMLKFVSTEEKQEKEFICKAKIIDVILRNGWNYISCSNCARKMEKTQATLSCKYCTDSKSVGVLRFRIEVAVDDGKDSTIFVIFDKEAKKMIKSTATALKAEHDKDDDKDDKAPASILNIVGKMHKFQVKVSSYNFSTKVQSFAVSRILEDISKSEIEEPQPKETNFTDEAQGSSVPPTRIIKIEDTGKEEETGKMVNKNVKRRKITGKK